MDSPLIQELFLGAQQAFRTIVPEPQNRTPWTWKHLPFIPFTFLPFLFLSYLARRPDTYLIRLLLLPSVITVTVAAAYGYYWDIPQVNVYNWGQSLMAAGIIAKALEYGLTPDGMLKVGESEPGKPKGKETANGNGHASHTSGPPSFVPTWFVDAMDLAHSLRGLGWKSGQGVYIPEHTRPLDRPAFLRATLLSFIKNFLILDLLESLVKLFPGVGTPSGGTMFYQELPILQRYTISTIIHMLTGSSLLAGFNMVYDLVTLIAVGLVNDLPENWPPILDRPWSSHSMHELWSKRWHQLLRRTFVVFGGIPGAWIAGPLGALLGTFVASGLYHECSMYTMGHGFDKAAIIFFGIQGPILILERAWRKVTGRRVTGWPGRLWVYFNMFVVAQPMIDSWHRRGLGGGMVIFPLISPARYILPYVFSFFTRR